jgi:hypothetical protein
MIFQGAKFGLLGAAVAASMLVVAPAASAARSSDVSAAKVKINKKKARSIGYFAPAASDARRAAMFDRAGGIAFDGFRFTPSGGATGRAVTVAVRARAANRGDVERVASLGSTLGSGLTPSAYSLGASVGWKHFAFTGDVAKVDGGLLPESRELADIGVSYAGKNWSTRLMVGAERATGLTANLPGPDQAMSVDLGGSYALTRNLELSGGVRYKSQVDRNELSSNDLRRDSQAIYIGTAFRF